MARVAPVASKSQAVVRTDPTTEIVPEFPGKDRFFDVSARAGEARNWGNHSSGRETATAGIPPCFDQARRRRTNE